MKLTTKVRYATRFLIDLARHQNRRPIQMSEIAIRQDISIKYLEQLSRPLRQANLISSIRGPKGGHRLAKPPEEITLGEITRIFQGPPEVVAKTEVNEEHPLYQDYLIRVVWRKATCELYDKLDQITLDSLITCFDEQHPHTT